MNLPALAGGVDRLPMTTVIVLLEISRRH